jgi:hypothetical protein
MIQLPDRIGKLIERLEKGEPVSQPELDRIAKLQALDLAHVGRKFAEQAQAEHERQLAFLEAIE